MAMTLVGTGYRPQLSELFDGPEPEAACVEFIADRYFAPAGLIRGWELDSVARLPIIVHGLSGNVASAMGPQTPYLEQIRRLADYTDAIIYSDHVALTGAHGRSLGHLAPNRFDDELLAFACQHIELMTQVTGRRPCLENLATKTTISGSAYSPEEFYLRLLEESDGWDCLLDLTNIWINSQNRPVDPYDFVDAIPPERIRYIHLAGGRWMHGELVDSHSESVHEEVYPLLARTLQRAHPEVILVERDSNWENACVEVRANLASARALVEATQDSSGNRRPRAAQVPA
jgi:uncharacterized protein (UPF0276 family)